MIRHSADVNCQTKVLSGFDLGSRVVEKFIISGVDVVV